MGKNTCQSTNAHRWLLLIDGPSMHRANMRGADEQSDQQQKKHRWGNSKNSSSSKQQQQQAAAAATAAAAAARDNSHGKVHQLHQ